LIDVDAVLRDIPHRETLCTIAELHGLAEQLRSDDRFDVRVAGESVGGVPIYHVRFGSGAARVLVVGGPQAQEAIGTLTVFSLLSLLRDGHPELVRADVEWHVVPCIDPDANLLNEGWYTSPWTVEGYVREFWMNPRPQQVDFSFPIHHKRLAFDRPSREALVLKGVLDEVRPDFYYTLHHYGPLGGAWFAISRDLGEPVYAEIGALFDRLGIRIQTEAPGSPQFVGGYRDISRINVKSYYDDLEASGVAIPEELLNAKAGASSYEYLTEIKPEAFVYVCELCYGTHDREVSDAPSEHEFRQLMLRLDADNKFLATVILEEWDRTHDDLDAASPFYRKLLVELVEEKDALHEGVTAWYSRPIQDLLFSPTYRGTARERDVVHAYGSLRQHFLCNAATSVRLLRASRQTERVRAAIDRLVPLFDAALADFWSTLSFGTYTVFECDTLARAHLGSGLIAMNAVLAP
jgi:hypothetical protein